MSFLGKDEDGRAVAVVFFVVVGQLVSARPCEEVGEGEKRASCFCAPLFKGIKVPARS